uniref:Peptidase A2 domain-containing protein n=1 Tax=Cacopsylla melanoneura TaxID=428564 RepID=A0A8D9F9Y3_9HEMI
MVLTKEQEKCVHALSNATKKRQTHWQSIQACHDLISKLADPTQLGYFEARCERINDVYSQFVATQDTITDLNNKLPEEEKITDVQSVAKSFDELYYAITATLRKISTVPPPPASASTSSSTPVKLPQINIPVFSGSYENFSSFHSLFKTLVHAQPGLTTIEKYSYLRSLLSGSALAVIQEFSFSENNYLLAYQTLVDQFSNKRVVANHICNKLWSFKPLTHDAQLKSFLDTFHVSVESFKAVGISETGDFLLLFMALRVLDSSTRQAFENSWIGKAAVPKYKDLLEFVRGRVSVADLIAPVESKSSTSRSAPPPGKSYAPLNKRAFTANVTSSEPSSKPVRGCPYCTKSHRINDCKKFLNLSVSDRYSFLKEKHLCFACFGPHSRQLCSSKFSCRQCGSKTHHTLLHSSPSPRDSATTFSSASSKDSPSPSFPPAVVSTTSTPNGLSSNFANAHLSKQVLLGTAVVSVEDHYGHFHDVRALIDAGSMINIITQPLAARLCLPMKPSKLSIFGVGSSQPMSPKGHVSCTIHSKHYPFSVPIDAAILPTISANIPALPVNEDVIDRLAGIPLADPNFFSPAPVQMLIGAQCYAEIMRRSEPIIPGEPSLVPSNLGILVMGVTPSVFVQSPPQYNFFISKEDDAITAQLRRFWEIEEDYSPVPASPEDIACEKHFCETVRRDNDGTYIVRLPFRDEKLPTLGNNRSNATNRLLKLEKRFESQPNLKKLYCENIQTYLDAGQMVVAT